MKFEKEFDLNGFNKEAVSNIVNKGNDFFQEEVKENGVLLCKMDRADIFEYEMVTGRKVLDDAKKLILQYSKDGSFDSGLRVLAEKSKIHNGPDYVGYLLILEMRKSVTGNIR